MVAKAVMDSGKDGAAGGMKRCSVAAQSADSLKINQRKCYQQWWLSTAVLTKMKKCIYQSEMAKAENHVK